MYFSFRPLRAKVVNLFFDFAVTRMDPGRCDPPFDSTSANRDRARLTQPLSWKALRRVFVNSMSDLFHKEVPRSFIDKVFDTMEKANWHTFQVLTKRSSLLTRYLNQRYPTRLAPSHIWLGVSVEDAKNAVRIKHLKAARASVQFVSFEPLIGPVGWIDLSGIDWAIAGGESSPRARPIGPARVICVHLRASALNLTWPRDPMTSELPELFVPRAEEKRS